MDGGSGDGFDQLGGFLAITQDRRLVCFPGALADLLDHSTVLRFEAVQRFRRCDALGDNPLAEFLDAIVFRLPFQALL